MNFGTHSARIRAPTNVKKGNFTFRNTAASRLPYHSRAPLKSVERYGTPVGLKTPIVTNGASSDMYSHYEASPMIYDKSYGIPMDTLAYDAWGAEEYFEDENMIIEKEEYPLKRKNAFVYPPKENMKNSLHSLPPTRVNSNSLNKSNDLVKSTPKRQAILCSDTPRGLGFKLNQKEKKSSEILRDDFPKPYPKWNPLDSPSRSHNKKTDKTFTFPRIYTVTVEKIQTWPKVLSCGQTIFELFVRNILFILIGKKYDFSCERYYDAKCQGILQKVIPIKQPKAQKLQLKSQKMKYHLMCTFYEIDRQLPKLAVGTWYRCIILLRYNKEYQCVSIRSATSNELKYLDKLVIESSKSMAILLKSSNLF